MLQSKLICSEHTASFSFKQNATTSEKTLTDYIEAAAYNTDLSYK